MSPDTNMQSPFASEVADVLLSPYFVADDFPDDGDPRQYVELCRVRSAERAALRAAGETASSPDDLSPEVRAVYERARDPKAPGAP